MCHSDILPNTLHLYLLHGQPLVEFGFFFNAARTLAITAISLCKRIYHCSVRLVSHYKKICKAFVKYAYFALPQNSLYSFETMADCIVRVISDCLRTGYCYAQQGCAQRDTAPLKEQIHLTKIATRVPTCISNTAFVVDSTKLSNGEDIRCDDMGSWIYTGSKTFSYHFDKGGKVHRGDDLENHKEYQLSHQFFKNKSLPSLRMIVLYTVHF